jgi:AraC-like DNA-binding protein
MVCRRCVLAVENILLSSKVAFEKVRLGEVILVQKLSGEQKDLVAQRLSQIGFELTDNLKAILTEKIKQLIIERARNGNDNKSNQSKLSYHISKTLHHEYTYLSSLFSAVEGRTIENYFMEQRIEKVKELLMYDELSLSQIAHMFDYSSTAYLSNQFKKVTGFNPSNFKLNYRDSRRSPGNVQPKILQLIQKVS